MNNDAVAVFPPKSWQEFEALCHRLWRDIWADPKFTWEEGKSDRAQRIGRPGNTIQIQFSRESIDRIYAEEPDLIFDDFFDSRQVVHLIEGVSVRQGSRKFRVHFSRSNALSPAVILLRALKRKLPANVTIIVSADHGDVLLDYVRSAGDPRVIVDTN